MELAARREGRRPRDLGLHRRRPLGLRLGLGSGLSSLGLGLCREGDPQLSSGLGVGGTSLCLRFTLGLTFSLPLSLSFTLGLTLRLPACRLCFGFCLS